MRQFEGIGQSSLGKKHLMFAISSMILSKAIKPSSVHADPCFLLVV
jgi:hypothetical protein